MEDRYQPAEIEPRWQKYWEENKTFHVGDDMSKPKYYVLDMFPYPSGDGLHVGHPEGYTATDILARYKRMKGFNVLHPMGWDAFGLPAERHAMRTGTHPAQTTRKNTDNFRRQIKRLGFSYDWDREIDTTDPDYYRWTQWIFLKLHEQGLAYQAEVPVNWCPAQGTVLANEEVKDGRYVETGDPVERRVMKQWMLKITAYAQRLLEDLEELDWPEGIKAMQRHWIGRSNGAEVVFPIARMEQQFKIFTTRPDTLFGATYCVLAPEHPLVAEITSSEQRGAVDAYLANAAAMTDRDRNDDSREKTGVFTGAYAVNPVNNAELPIYVADYVLMHYGTGAIMAVPGHDERDWEFAKKYDLPILEVVSGGDVSEAAYVGDGPLVHSQFLDGLAVEEAKEKIGAWLEERGVGTSTVTYRLRDWLFSRQRYWGEPFPVLHLEDGTYKVVPEDQLPVRLPDLDNYKPTADGQPPLARAEEWVKTTDPESGLPATRELNTMPQWAGSCWYYLRYIDPHNTEKMIDPEKENYWMPVDLYVGGAEHAVLHLLYARFWHKVLFDCGVVSTKEPFQKLFNQGMILKESFRGESGKYYYREQVTQNDDKNWVAVDNGEAVNSKVEKMSKSRFNVVNPDEVVEKYGADAMRAYEMFMGPLDRDKPWTDEGVQGIYRFLCRVWRLFINDKGEIAHPAENVDCPESLLRAYHKMIKKVGEDIADMKFNTAISAKMEFVNAATKSKAAVPHELLRGFALALAPTCPHLAEELWHRLGEEHSLAYEAWPAYDPTLAAEDLITFIVQVNGKVRAKLEVEKNLDQDALKALVYAEDAVKRGVDGKNIVREIHVPNRLFNIVAK